MEKNITTLEEHSNQQKMAEIYTQSLKQETNLGKIVESYSAEFGQSDQTTKMFEGNPIEYPYAVKQALVEIVGEYNSEFANIIEKAKTAEEDYQFCDGQNFPTSIGVQIDMVALSPEILKFCENLEMSIGEVKLFLKKHIFEIENNLAGYTFLGAMNPKFRQSSTSAIDRYRESTAKKVYILATTQNKFESIAAGEFGKSSPDSVYDQKVLRESGFDGIMGPQEFIDMIKSDEELPLFYVRSSLDTSQLKNPNQARSSSLLDNPDYVKIIRQNSITPNVDYADSTYKTNDTKEYMTAMNLGYKVETVEDIFDTAFLHLLSNPKLRASMTVDFFNPKFVNFCTMADIDINSLLSGSIKLRAKPNVESYGCYGHIREPFGQKFVNQITKELKIRGSYMVQPEMEIMQQTNTFDGESYKCIDRNFLMVDSQGEVQFVCGYRSHLNINTTEAKKNNIHGNNSTIYSNIN